jgi:hypothetical protein
MIVTAEVINTADAALLAALWLKLPQPSTDAEKDLVERLAIRVEGEGMLDEDGRLRA